MHYASDTTAAFALVGSSPPLRDLNFQRTAPATKAATKTAPTTVGTTIAATFGELPSEVPSRLELEPEFGLLGDGEGEDDGVGVGVGNSSACGGGGDGTVAIGGVRGGGYTGACG